jgi:RimJ/RimL family protein N-acetyltransferase
MDEDVASYLTTWPAKMSPSQARERIAAAQERFARMDAIDLAILSRDSRGLLGWISLMVECRVGRTASIGFWLGRQFQGRGIMSEAATAAMPAAAEILDARAIEANVYPWNSASIALLRKLSFRVEGGNTLYSPVRQRNEDAFLYRRILDEAEVFMRVADAA